MLHENQMLIYRGVIRKCSLNVENKQTMDRLKGHAVYGVG